MFDVVVDVVRRDNIGVGGIVILLIVVGFFLVIMVDVEFSFLLCVVVWFIFKWGFGIFKK